MCVGVMLELGKGARVNPMRDTPPAPNTPIWVDACPGIDMGHVPSDLLTFMSMPVSDDTAQVGTLYNK
jgi:hypothetical protein